MIGGAGPSILAILVGVWQYLIIVLIGTFLMANGGDHFLMCLLVIRIYSCMKRPGIFFLNELLILSIGRTGCKSFVRYVLQYFLPIYGLLL